MSVDQPVVIGDDADVLVNIFKHYVGMPQGVAEVDIRSIYSGGIVRFKCTRPTLERLIEEMQQALKAIK